MKFSKYKYDKWIIFSLLIFFIISIASIYSASVYASEENLVFKQLLWYVIGTLLVIAITRLDNDYFYENYKLLYIGGNVLLLLLLFFGPSINGSKCWFIIPKIGSFQPSEFMKIFLAITLAIEANKFNQQEEHTLKQEFFFILKIIGLTLLPSFLTFLQPDTGVVIIYFVIAFFILFASKIRKSWFIIGFSILALLFGTIFYLYFYNKDLFIQLFSTELFYRLERILDWKQGVGYQLENSLTSIGSSGIFGHGFNNLPLYFPEPATDFIFSVFASNFGFIGCILLISTILVFDFRLLSIASQSHSIDRYLVFSLLGMLLYQQVQNISMTLGLLPITGITLPFISYGGSSLISYMLIIGIVLNSSNTVEQTKKRSL